MGICASNLSEEEKAKTIEKKLSKLNSNVAHVVPGPPRSKRETDKSSIREKGGSAAVQPVIGNPQDQSPTNNNSNNTNNATVDDSNNISPQPSLSPMASGGVSFPFPVSSAPSITKSPLAKQSSILSAAFLNAPVSAQDQNNENILKQIEHGDHGHNKTMMTRNRWGVLKANLQEVVVAETLKSKGDLTEEDRKALDDLATKSVAVAHRPRSSFSDSKFAKKAKGGMTGLSRPNNNGGSRGPRGGGGGLKKGQSYKKPSAQAALAKKEKVDGEARKAERA